MENSPIETLRQLKEMLDAGTITPAEFDALKQKLVFNAMASNAPTELPDAAGEVPGPPATEDSNADFASAPQPTNWPTVTELSSANLPPPVEPAAPAFTPLPEIEAQQISSETEPEVYESELEPLPPRNPLNLILSIGGLLALLALVLYLSLNRPPSEHLTSTSQTAADSLAAPVEEGPQVEQPEPFTAATPETVRLAPANPAPPIVRPQPAARDTVAPATTSAVDSASRL